MAGRPPKPNRLKKLTGSKHYRPDALEAPAAKPACPSYLSDYAKSEWRYIVPRLERLGILAKVDRVALAAYCESVATFREATEELQRQGSRAVIKTTNGNLIQNPWLGIRNRAAADLLRWSTEFGMTPSARSRFTVASGKEETPDLAEALFEAVHGGN